MNEEIFRIEKELDRLLRPPTWRKITTAKKPTYILDNETEGIEIESNAVRPFRMNGLERIYDQEPGQQVQNVLDVYMGKKKEAIPQVIVEEKTVAPQGAAHNSLVIGSTAALAGQYGIPSELADLFFVKFENKLYIKNPGLLWLAAKKGYGHMEVTDSYNEKNQEWEAEYRIYPVLTKEILDGISKLDVSVQMRAIEVACRATNGKGRAGPDNIKMNTMLKFARELAQTRAQNRALRAYTGYGGTSAEELERGEV